MVQQSMYRMMDDASFDDVITYPRFKEIRQQIQMCLDRTAEGNEAQCMVLEGGTGVGKTTLVRNFASTFVKPRDDFGNHIPVLYVQTPSPVTVKGMASAMLESLGDPASYRGTASALSTRLAAIIRGCRVGLIILDDIQHLIDTRGRMKEVSEWLKVLIKNTKVPFLIVGLENEVTPILKINPQLQRLFSANLTLEPFKFDDDVNKMEYSYFIKQVQDKYDVRMDEGVDQLELIYRVYHTTKGYAGYTINFLRDCKYLAVKRSIERIEKKKTVPSGRGDFIDLAILNEAFTSRFEKSGIQNPFVKDFTVPFVPDPNYSKSKKWHKKATDPKSSKKEVVDELLG